MATRAIHYDPDADESDRVFCGTDGEFWPEHLTAYPAMVTCKRCLKMLNRIGDRRALETMESKAAAWENLSRRATEIGYTDPWDALAELCRQKGVPVFSEF